MELYFNKLGSGPPVIILHGFLGTSDNWITVARHFEDRFTFYLVDQRNHGRSPHSDSHTVEDMSADLRKLIIEQGIQDPILIGHSMGGKVIMQYSTEYPDDFNRLIVVDIAPKYYPPHHGHVFQGLNAVDISNLTSRGQADEQMSPYITNPATRQFLMKNLTRKEGGLSWKPNIPVLEKAADSIGKAIEGKAVTEKTVLFVRGSESDYILPEDRPQIKEMYPSAKILTIRDAGHWVHADQREAFIKTLEVLMS